MESTRPDQCKQRAGVRFSLVVFVALFAAQIALYHQSFLVKPSGDDLGPPLTEIARGEREGPLVFFLDSEQDSYRPLQSMTMWLFGRLSETHTLTWIHVMHFMAMGAYGLACLLWTRQLGLGRIGVLVAAIVTFAHPAFGGPLGGLDNFSGIVAHALMWLGALTIIVWRERFPLAMGAALLCLIAGSLYKEYAFGLVPLAALTALVYSPRKPLARAIVIGVVLLGFMLASLMARPFLGLEHPNLRVPLRSPGYMVPMIAHNAALLAAATVFTGNTIWVNISRSPLAIGWVIANAGSLIALVSTGVVMMLRSRAGPEAEDDPIARRPGRFTSRRWVVFLLLSFLAASFPANMIPYRVSEIYVTGLILPLALLCGLAAEGFARGSKRAQYVAGVLAAAHVVVACAAVSSKVHGLRAAGDQAARMLDQIAALLPDEARDQTVALVFIASELDALPHYSVFLQLADRAVGGARSLDYRLPGRQLRVERVYVERLDEVDLDAHELIIRWDQETARFERMK